MTKISKETIKDWYLSLNKSLSINLLLKKINDKENKSFYSSLLKEVKAQNQIVPF